MSTRTYALLAIISLLTAGARAAFMVEAHSSGLANQNYTGAGVPSSSNWPSRAVGVTAINAVWGSSTGEAVYVFSYTPSPTACPDVDNVVFTAGTDLGNASFASGLRGGMPGLYNVYATWPESTNVKAEGCNFTITNEGDDVFIPMVQQQTILGKVPPGSHNWLKIADRVRLVTGRTYTVTQAANSTGGVCMRSHGVMWELVEPDEPVADIDAVGGAIYVEEGGGPDEYSIALKAQPPMTVTVTAQPSEPNQLILNGQPSLALTFTSDNWNIPQVVTVVAEEDASVEAPKTVWILHMTEIADANLIEWHDAFAGLLVASVRDKDAAAVEIRESDGSTAVSEHGPTSDEYTVALSAPPVGNVTVTVRADAQTMVDAGAGPAQSVELLFGPADWSTPRTVSVIAVDDANIEGTHVSVITHSVGGLDGNYAGLDVRDVVVTVEDNECGAWGYLPWDLNKDCIVNLMDMAQFAASWLDCTQPYEENCTDVR